MKPSASGLVSIADMMVADSCLVASKLAFLLSEMRKWNISVAVESDIWNNDIEYSHYWPVSCVMESMVSVMLTWTQPWNSLSLVTASQWVILPEPGPPAGTPNSIYISIVTEGRGYLPRTNIIGTFGSLKCLMIFSAVAASWTPTKVWPSPTPTENNVILSWLVCDFSDLPFPLELIALPFSEDGRDVLVFSNKVSAGVSWTSKITQ